MLKTDVVFLPVVQILLELEGLRAQVCAEPYQTVKIKKE